MTTYKIDNWNIEETDDLYDLICEYIYQHNFDEEYIIESADIELDDVVLEIKDSESLHIEIGVLDESMAVANYKMGFLYTAPLKHEEDYVSLQDHVKDVYSQVR